MGQICLGRSTLNLRKISPPVLKSWVEQAKIKPFVIGQNQQTLTVRVKAADRINEFFVREKFGERPLTGDFLGKLAQNAERFVENKIPEVGHFWRSEFKI